MKAAILVEQNKPLLIKNVQLPSKLGYGQVLVKIHYSGICGSQLNEIDGIKGPDKFLPHLLGHEGSGIVEMCGEGVTTVKKNDHVVLHWRKSDGLQSATPKYHSDQEVINAGWVTTFNEYAVVSENRITPIPKNFDLKLAALYGCAIPTAFGVIHRDAQIKSGDSVVIIGCGGVGMAIAQAASLMSAYPIVAVDINDYKLSLVKKFGATHTINSKMDESKKAILELLPDGADAVIETTGISSIRELAYELTNKDGTTVFVGVPKKGEKIHIDSFPLHFNKKITGSHGGDANPSYDIPRLIRLQQSGKFDLQEMISHTFPLDKINEAIHLLRTGNVARCIIKMDHIS